MSSAKIQSNEDEVLGKDSPDITQPQGSQSAVNEEYPGMKLFKVFKKNWVLFVGITLIGGVYFGLNAIKNSLKVETGSSTTYHNPVVPDREKANIEEEEKQAKNDRLGAANRVVEEERIATTITPKDSSASNLKTYSVKNVYKKLLNGSSTATPSQVETKHKVEISQPEKVLTPKERIANVSEISKSISAVRRKGNKEVKETSSSIIKEESGFNTVVLNSTTNEKVNSTSKKKDEFIKAAIYGMQTVRSGSPVRIRILEGFMMGEEEVPTNSVASGIALLGGNRLNIIITSINVHGQNLSVKKIVYDKDLVIGIAYNGEDAVRQGVRQNQNSTIDQTTSRVLNNVPIVGGAAGVGIAAGASVIGGISSSIRYGGVQKRTGEIQLEEGYKVFLKNE